MIVGPERCLYCCRAIYLLDGAWVHTIERPWCYAPNGDKRQPRPERASVTQDTAQTP